MVFEEQNKVEMKKATGFKIEINLDRVESIQEVECQFQDRILSLECKDKYSLRIEINGDYEEEYKAQFIKKQKKLVLTFQYKKKKENKEQVKEEQK